MLDLLCLICYFLYGENEIEQSSAHISAWKGRVLEKGSKGLALFIACYLRIFPWPNIIQQC